MTPPAVVSFDLDETLWEFMPMMDGALRRTIQRLEERVPALAGTTDINDFNLTETTSTYGGGTQYHVTTGGSTVGYRWLDSPIKTTVIFANACADLAYYGSDTIGVNDTNYHNLFLGSAYLLLFDGHAWRHAPLPVKP